MVPAPQEEMTRVDSALSVYRSARNAIIAINRKFPRPLRLRSGQSADTARVSRAPDVALASADETIRSAWTAMGVQQPLSQPKQQPLAVVPPPAPVTTAAVLPREPEAQAPKSAPPLTKPFKAQAALGLLVPLNPAGEVNFRPWWNMGYYASYREIDAEAQFSRGLGVDLSLYTFSEKEYNKYYAEDEDKRVISKAAAPMLIIDVGYYLKYYPVSMFKIPYISGSIGISGAFGGGGMVSYNGGKGVSENFIEDVYLSNVALGVGADYPVYAGIRAFADVQYSLRLGLYSMFDKNVQYVGGLVPQIPIKFGVIAPFNAIADILRF
jgi:hypothetical protein